jgi:thioredoxin
MAVVSFTALHAQTNLDAASFSDKIKQTPTGQIVDVRTSGEFTQGHITNAQNIDVRSSDFQQNASKLDKNKAVFVYCLSGGRSASAMNILSSMGFKEIYNLSKGIMSWRAANMPETTDVSAPKPTVKEMTLLQYQALLNSDKLVLVDFYADWCVPCQKMKPSLDEISKEMKDKVVIIRIDADANKTLAKALKVDALPVLKLYKAKKLVWSYKEYISKNDLVKRLKMY